MGKILTISIAAYNVEDYISKTLESCVVNSSLQDQLEVLIVNDGSTDHTLETAKKFEMKYPELFRIIDKKNGGYGSTINSALEVARGKYFRILDGDDWLDTHVLENLLVLLKMRDEDVIFTNSKHVLMNKDCDLKIRVVSYGEDIANQVLQLNNESRIRWSMHNMTVRTELLRNNQVVITENCFYTDGEFVFYVMNCMENYYCIDEVLYQYRIGREGQSVSREGRIKHREDALKVLDQELDYLCRTPISNVSKKDLVVQFVADTAAGVISYYLLCPYNHTNKVILQKIDQNIKKKNMEVFVKMGKKTRIKHLRAFHYHSYLIWQWNEIRKMHRLENM